MLNFGILKHGAGYFYCSFFSIFMSEALQSPCFGEVCRADAVSWENVKKITSGFSAILSAQVFFFIYFFLLL